MPTFELIRRGQIPETFRAKSVASKFDIQSDDIVEKFSGNIDFDGKDWSVGLIVGPSGSGKTTISKELFKDQYIRQFSYMAGCILDDMPKEKNVDEITRTFHSVGFGSAKSWLKPYSVLSTGEQMRADLARAILEEREIIVFDEYTSVVNREIAKIGSYAVQKAIRKLGKKFIAVTCHYDVADWLEPDWVFNTETMSFFLPQITNGHQSNWSFLNVTALCGGILGSITI
jgi:ABC-type lipoprotein export system ATPase subunit